MKFFLLIISGVGWLLMSIGYFIALYNDLGFSFQPFVLLIWSALVIGYGFLTFLYWAFIIEPINDIC